MPFPYSPSCVSFFKKKFSMKVSKLIIPLTAAAILIGIAACEKKKCADGYVSVDDKCECPEGRFEAQRVCRELEPNEYYAAMTDCPCQDTFFFKILEFGSDHIRYRHNMGSGVSISEGILDYYKTPSGDSIANGTDFVSYRYCDIGPGIRGLPRFYGKFQSDGSIKVKVLYISDIGEFPVVDSCQFVMRR